MDSHNSSSMGPTATAVAPEVKELPSMNMPYLLSEIFVAILAVVGNALTLYVFVLDRKLRRLTNYYIASLALADLLVGILGVPFAILTSLGLPRILWACLLMLSFLVVLCTISIFCLLAVSIDRYWAILYPLVYSRIMTGKMARRIILLCWFLGTLIGLLPVFGWHDEEEGMCVFTHIMDYDFLVFLYFVTIVGPGVLMSFFYAHIYSVVLKQLRHIASQKQSNVDAESTVMPDTKSLKSVAPRTTKSHPFSVQSLRHSLKCVTCFSGRRKADKNGGVSSTSAAIALTQSSSNLKVTSPTNQAVGVTTSDSESPLFNPQFSKPNGKEIKAAKNLSIIVLFFFFCWFPLYTINCVQAFCPACFVPAELIYFTIILSHANSAINPLLYAYHMKDFRRALQFHVLQRLGFTRFKRSSHEGPMSPHYTTVLNVNVTPTSTMTRSPSPYLGASLAPTFTPTPSPLPFRLFRPDRSTSSLVPNLSTVEIKSKASSSDKIFQMPLGQEHRRPLNSTFSWPPSMLSRSLVSHQSLLDSDTSISSLRRVRSAEPLVGIQFPPLKDIHPPPCVNSPTSTPEITLLCGDSFDGSVDRAKTAVQNQEPRCKSLTCSPVHLSHVLSTSDQQEYRESPLSSSNCSDSCDSQSLGDACSGIGVNDDDDDVHSREIEILRDNYSTKNFFLRSKSDQNLFQPCQRLNHTKQKSLDQNKLSLGEQLCCLPSKFDIKLQKMIPSDSLSSKRNNLISDVIKIVKDPQLVLNERDRTNS